MQPFFLTGRRARATRLVVGLAAIAACSDSSSAPEPPKTPAAVAVVSGDRQTGTVGAALPAPIVVRVTAAGGQPIPKTPVEFVVTSGGGRTATSTVITDETGSASQVWTLGTSASAAQTVDVYALDLNTGKRAAHASITATAKASAPTGLQLRSGSQQQAMAGSKLADSLSVRVADQFDNPVAGVVVTWQPDATSGIALPATTTTDADGIAKTSWQLGTTTALQRLMARTPFGEQAFTATATPAIAAKLTLAPRVALLRIGGTQQLTASTTSASGTPVPRPIDWKTLDGRTATVSADGLVRAVAAGSTMIVASADQVADTASISVAAPPTARTLAASAVTGSSATLNGEVVPGVFGATAWFEIANNAGFSGSTATDPRTVTAGISVVAVSAPVSSLSAGTTYYFRAVAASGPDTVRGDAMSLVTPSTAPATPTNVSATPVAGDVIEVRWTTGAGNPTSFPIERAEGSGAFQQIAQAPAGANVYVDAGVKPQTTYSYRVGACNGSTCSLVSQPVTAITPAAGGGTAPTGTPTGLTAQYNPTTGLVGVAWQYANTDASYFRVLRTEGSSPTPEQFATQVGLGQRSLVDDRVSAATAHSFSYVVQACNAAACGSSSAPAVLAIPRLEPPTQLTADILLANRQVTFTWKDNSANETAFDIYERDPSGAYGSRPVVSVPANTTTTTHFLDPNTTKYFVVHARLASSNPTFNRSAASNEVSASTAVSGGTPPAGAMTNLAGQYNPANGTVTLTWQYADAANTTYYNIRRNDSPPNSNLDVIFTTPMGPNQLSWVDRDVDASVTHGFFYRVTPCNASGCGTTVGTPQTGIAAPRLEPPSNLAASVNGSTLTLTWTDNSSNESGFEIYSRQSGGSYGTAIGSVAANTTTFSTTLPPNSSQFFVVRSILPPGNVAGFNRSVPSNEVIGATATGSPPTAVTMNPAPINSTSVGFQGSATPNGLPTTTYFEYSTDPNFATSQKSKDYDAGSGATYAYGHLATLTANTTYYYRTVATNAAGTSRGATVRVRTAAPAIAPTVQGQYVASNGSVVLTWPPTNEVESLSWRITRTEPGAPSETFSIFSTTYTDHAITAATTHSFTYTVAGCNGVGCGPESAPVAVTAPRLEPPSNVAVTVTPAGAVTLTWSDNSSNEAGFYVYWRSAANTQPSPNSAFVAANATSYSTTMPVGDTYYYLVRATLNASSSQPYDLAVSVPSNEVLATTPSAGQAPTVETLPLDFVTTGSGHLQGNFTPNGLVTSAFFEYGTDPNLAGATASTPTNIGAGTNPILQQYVANVPANTTVYYRAAATNSAGTTRGAIQSFYSGVPTSPPTNVQVQYVASTGVVTITWQNATQGYRQSRIVRTEGGSTETFRGEGTSFTDLSIDPLTAHSYSYTVSVCTNVSTCGPASGPVTVGAPRLEPPTNLVTSTTAAGVATLTWSDNSGNESGFTIYERNLGGTTVAVGTVAANTRTFSRTIVPDGDTRYYVVRAMLPKRGGGGQNPVFTDPVSLPSNEAAAAAPMTPAAPYATTLGATGVSRTSAALQGTATPNGLPTTTYFEWGTDATLAVRQTSQTFDAGRGSATYAFGVLIPTAGGLTPNTTYYFRTVAVNSMGTTRSDIASFKTAP